MSAVFVTGATGQVGSALVESLIGRGERVIAAVRGPEDAAGLPSGVETRLFEFGQSTAELDIVLEGVDRLFLMRPPAIENVQKYLFPVIDAALKRGAERITFLSLQGVKVNRKTPHYAVEQYLTSVDAAYTFLRPNFFMQNLSGTYADDIRDRGEIIVPAGHALTAFIDARDIARVAAIALTEPGHERAAYTLSGRQSLSYAMVARIMTDVLGRPIRYTRPSEKAYLSRLAANGYPSDYISVQKMIYRVVRMNTSALPNRSIERLTGHPATTLREFVTDNRDVWMQPTRAKPNT